MTPELLEADRLLKELTGQIGGIAEVNWYALRNGIAEAIRAARNDALEGAAKWHDAEIARLNLQIEENDRYLDRVGTGTVSVANQFCRELINGHSLSAAAIRRMKS